MNLIKNDYFNQLYIKDGLVNKENVEKAYQLINAEVKKKNIKDREKLRNWLKNKSEAYKYCSSETNIQLRNKIIELSENHKLPRVKEEHYELQNVDSSITLRKGLFKSEVFEDYDMKIICLERFQLMNGIQNTGNSINRYQIMVDLYGEDFIYDFYSEKISMSELENNSEYKAYLLRAIEMNNMYGKNRYIGTLIRNKDGKLCLFKNIQIENAVDQYEMMINGIKIFRKNKGNTENDLRYGQDKLIR